MLVMMQARAHSRILQTLCRRIVDDGSDADQRSPERPCPAKIQVFLVEEPAEIIKSLVEKPMQHIPRRGICRNASDKITEYACKSVASKDKYTTTDPG